MSHNEADRPEDGTGPARSIHDQVGDIQSHTHGGYHNKKWSPRAGWERHTRAEVNYYLDDVVETTSYPGGTYAVIALSFDPRLDNGKVGWGRREERWFSWPDEREDLIATVLENAPVADISICPNVFAARKRRKGTALVRMTVHADVDDGFDERQADRVRELPGGCAVYSGAPGHAHVYANLNEPLTTEEHSHLCGRLGDWFDADDHKVSDNDLMRLPGTWNFKPCAHDPDADPLPVTWAVLPRRRSAPHRLAQFMGTTKAAPASFGDGSTPYGPGHDAPREAVDLSRRNYRRVGVALAEDTGDRSEDTMRIVGACVDSFLTLPQARWVVDQRDDLAGRLAHRSRDDVWWCWQKVTTERRARSGPVHNKPQESDGQERDDADRRRNPGRRIRLIPAGEIEDGVPEWVWEYRGEGRIQRSVTTLFAGRPGAGKSTAGRSFAADFTRGLVEGCWKGQPQNVAYIAAEEPLDLVVKPSLRAHGADMSRVFFPEVSVVDHDGADRHAKLLSVTDEDTLTALFLEYGITVVVVDPVMATIQSSADVHRNNEVREYMEPWTRIAERINGTVIAIVHLRKATTGDVVAAITGSSAFGEVARCVFGFAKDPNSNDDERVMSQAKNSCGLEDLSLAYAIERTTITTDSGRTTNMARFVIKGDSDTTVSEVLGAQRRQKRLTLPMQLLLGFVEARDQTTPADVVEADLASDNKLASQQLRRLLDKGLIAQMARGEYGPLSRAKTGEESEESEE